MTHNGCALKNVAQIVPCGDNKITIGVKVEKGTVNDDAANNFLETCLFCNQSPFSIFAVLSSWCHLYAFMLTFSLNS
jgi:hypothetical protein